jgi:hypothetical protein
VTPLAHHLVASALNNSLGEYNNTVRSHLNGIRCFEVTDIFNACEELDKQINGPSRDELYYNTSFLPHPKTWLEWIEPKGRGRVGLLLTHVPAIVGPQDLDGAGQPSAWAEVRIFKKGGFSVAPQGFFPLYDTDYERPEDFPDMGMWYSCGEKEDQINQNTALGKIVRLAVTLINSPHVVIMRERRCKKEFARKVARVIPNFPVHSWHEVRLHVRKPREVDDGQPHQDIITGQRALHYVRKFMRIRLGRLEHVRAHWRGNPDIGVHHSDYRVSP